MTEREIFIAALHQHDPAQRAALLDQACGADQALRRRVEELLREQEQLGSFLEQPAAGTRIGPYKLLQLIGEGGMGLVYIEIGDFRIEKRIGAGGMGIVYRARQLSLDRPVALKLLGNALTDRGAVARFRREAQAVAKLHHPNIATVYFVGQDHDLCFMAMEHIEGVTLREVMDRLAASQNSVRDIDALVSEKPPEERAGAIVRFDAPGETVDEEPALRPDATERVITPSAKQLIASKDYIRRCCTIIRNAALALDYAHKQGVIHRDIKPANLMLDRAGEVHLIDFGIARFFEDMTVTQTGQLVGTPMYMSPEQVTGQLTLDHRTDIYSLGLVLYEMLTLRPPITAPSKEDLFRRIMMKTMLPARWMNRSIPRDIESIIHKAIAKDPDERYTSAAEFAADLQSALDHKSIHASTYRYQFDENEIVATRPALVVGVAILLFVESINALLLFMNHIVVIVRSFRVPGRAFPWQSVPVVSSAGLVFLLPFFAVCLFVAGKGILSGKRWARWLGIYLLYLIIIILLLYGTSNTFYEVLRDTDYRSIMADWWAPYLWLPSIIICSLCIICNAISIYVLLQRRTADWFRIATRLRSEYQKQQTKSTA